MASNAKERSEPVETEFCINKLKADEANELLFQDSLSGSGKTEKKQSSQQQLIDSEIIPSVRLTEAISIAKSAPLNDVWLQPLPVADGQNDKLQYSVGVPIAPYEPEMLSVPVNGKQDVIDDTARLLGLNPGDSGGPITAQEVDAAALKELGLPANASAEEISKKVNQFGITSAQSNEMIGLPADATRKQAEFRYTALNDAGALSVILDHYKPSGASPAAGGGGEIGADSKSLTVGQMIGLSSQASKQQIQDRVAQLIGVSNPADATLAGIEKKAAELQVLRNKESQKIEAKELGLPSNASENAVSQRQWLYQDVAQEMASGKKPTGNPNDF
jgi:hypothetical protein